jgi:hypothetical protein
MSPDRADGAAVVNETPAPNNTAPDGRARIHGDQVGIALHALLKRRKRKAVAEYGGGGEDTGIFFMACLLLAARSSIIVYHVLDYHIALNFNFLNPILLYLPS